MSARKLDGKVLAQKVRNALAKRAAKLRKQGCVPGLAVILVGEDPASHIYVRGKERAAAEVGVRTFDHKLPADTPQSRLLERVEHCNRNPAVNGILVQLPLPRHIDPYAVLVAITPAKDVDGFHPENIGLLAQGRPRVVAATPRGCMVLIAETGVELSGSQAVVVGRSPNVGRPMAMLLTNANATVTLCHSKTADLPAQVAKGEIVVVAVGRAEMIKGAWIKPGAVVVDVGINRGQDGGLRGDVEYAAAFERARAITPVPGGVGPMTIAALLENTIEAAERAARANR